MRMFMIVAAVLTLARGTPAAQAASATQVLNHHITTIKAGNLEGVMSDYADNAVVIAPHGLVPGQPDVSGVDVFAGKENVRKLFAVLTDADHVKAIATMQTRFEDRGNDVILMHWTQYKGMPQEVNGTDTWVIRNGKVLFQLLTVEPTKVGAAATPAGR